MNQATTIAVAATVGIVGALAVIALGPFGLRDKAAVSATITLSMNGDVCVARTLPATLLAGRRDVVQWTVTGSCTDKVPDNVEVRFVGLCGAQGAKGNQGDQDLFDQSPPHRGRKIRRTVKHNSEGCFSYQVVYEAGADDVVLEDPELEIVQY